ncbi:hypothetical protein GCM10023340_15230 [Nocardioides marinquilinus]|uniref:Uncharacterized protein n=1 Tax=Nocardioides marinquilinus TaxID=1210400 RepID=A0ABP9PG28_9ACTN
MARAAGAEGAGGVVVAGVALVLVGLVAVAFVAGGRHREGPGEGERNGDGRGCCCSAGPREASSHVLLSPNVEADLDELWVSGSPVQRKE